MLKLSEKFLQALSGLLKDNQIGSKRTIYDVLASKQGVEEFYRIIYQLLTTNMKHEQQRQVSSGEYIKTAPNINGQSQSNILLQSKGQGQHSNTTSLSQSSFDPQTLGNNIELDFFQFLGLLTEIFKETAEFQNQAQEWFLLFEVNDKVCAKDLYLLICLSISQFYGQTLEFFYQFGDLIFQSLKQQHNDKVFGLTISAFCKVIGIKARKFQKLFQNLNYKTQEEYTFEEFEIFCFALGNSELSQGQGSSVQKFNKQPYQIKSNLNSNYSTSKVNPQQQNLQQTSIINQMIYNFQNNMEKEINNISYSQDDFQSGYWANKQGKK